MKNFILLIIVFLFCVISGLAQFNSNGYNEKTGEWNVEVHSYRYWWDENNPSIIHSFSWDIENKTAYTITAIDIEFSLYHKGKLFYKKLMYVTISPEAYPGEYVSTDTWRMSIPFKKSRFDKNTTWSATVKAIYGPSSN